mmetsp:Transcript_22936/g.52960  ORF Transcript_22936/g.52960 Transcript_22936/m.52960 type:complete len:330 (+) Transcript_22936:568-1557(+)
MKRPALNSTYSSQICRAQNLRQTTRSRHVRALNRRLADTGCHALIQPLVKHLRKVLKRFDLGQVAERNVDAGYCRVQPVDHHRPGDRREAALGERPVRLNRRAGERLDLFHHQDERRLVSLARSLASAATEAPPKRLARGLPLRDHPRVEPCHEEAKEGGEHEHKEVLPPCDGHGERREPEELLAVPPVRPPLLPCEQVVHLAHPLVEEVHVVRDGREHVGEDGARQHPARAAAAHSEPEDPDHHQRRQEARPNARDRADADVVRLGDAERRLEPRVINGQSRCHWLQRRTAQAVLLDAAGEERVEDVADEHEAQSDQVGGVAPHPRAV